MLRQKSHDEPAKRVERKLHYSMSIDVSDVFPSSALTITCKKKCHSLIFPVRLFIDLEME